MYEYICTRSKLKLLDELYKIDMIPGIIELFEASLSTLKNIILMHHPREEFKWNMIEEII